MVENEKNWLKGKRTQIFLALFFAIIAVSGVYIHNIANAITTPPSIITYQGKLLYNDTAVTSTQNIAFILYDSLSGGTALYTAAGTLPSTSTISVTPNNGLFNVDLGGSGTNALSASIFQNNATIYLEVVVGGQALSPRKQITSAPFAINSQFLNGLSATSTPTTSAYIPASDSNGNFSFSGNPQSTSISGGVMYINPTTASASSTIFGIADNGTQRFRVSKEGDTAVAGTFAIGATSTSPVNSNLGTYNFYNYGTSFLNGNTEISGDLTLLSYSATPVSSPPPERLPVAGRTASNNILLTGNVFSYSAGYFLYGGGFGDGFKLRLDASTDTGSTISSVLPIAINSSSTLSLNTTHNTAITAGTGLFTIGGSLYASSTVSIGTSTSEFRLTMDNDGGIIARGTFGSGNDLVTTGTGTRLIWYPKKGAFRAGYAIGTEWDDANTGNLSAAFGMFTKSSGTASFAIGRSAWASGDYSLAGGWSSVASGAQSFAYGNTVTVSGISAVGFGQGFTNSTDYSLAVGYGDIDNIINGNGDSWLNATVGNVGVGTTTPSDKLTVDGSLKVTATTTVQGGLYSERNLQNMTPISTASYAQGSFYSAVAGNYLYVADASYGTRIIDVSDPANPQGLSTVASDGTALGVAVSGNYLYIADSGAGIKIVDISNPKSPVVLKTLSLGSNWSNRIFVSGNYAYVAGTIGLDIIDISDPENSYVIGSYTPNTNCLDVWVKGKYAFLANGLNFRIVDVSSPSTPVLFKTLALSDTAYSVFVSGRYAYLAAFSALQVVDISDINTPVTVGSYDNAGVGTDVYVSGNRAYLSAGASGLYVLDISSATPTLIKNYSTGIANAYAATINGGYLYLSDYTNGVKIFDVSGAKITNSDIGNVRVSNLDVSSRATFGENVAIKSGLTVSGNGLMITGNFSMNTPTSTNNTTATNTLSFSHTALFKSSATTSESNLFIFDTKNSFSTSNSSTAFLLSVRNNGAAKFSVASNGDVAAAGNFYAASVYVGTPGNVGDLSERVDIAVDDVVEPGDVLMVDPTSADTYRRTAGQYEQAVAGVVSTNPVIIVGNGKTDYTAVLAMVGRVPVKVTDENGPIKRGDLLVSATQPGYAMKYDANKDSNKMVGIIGVALDSLESGSGKVMSLIRTGWANSHTQSIATLRQNIQELASSQGISINTNPSNLNVESSNGQLVYNGGNLDMQGNIILNIASIAGKNDRWSIDANGHFITRVDTTDGKKEMYSIQSPVSEFVFSSSSQLVAGEVKINFDSITKQIIDFSQVLKVSVTLTSGEAKGVYVSEKTTEGFTVKELGGGNSNASFDWMVVAKRKDGLSIQNNNLPESPVVVSEVIPEITPSSTPDSPVSSTPSQGGNSEPTPPPVVESAPVVQETPVVVEPVVVETPVVETPAPTPEPPANP